MFLLFSSFLFFFLEAPRLESNSEVKNVSSNTEKSLLCQHDAAISYPDKFLLWGGVVHFESSTQHCSFVCPCLVSLWLFYLSYVLRGSCWRGICPGHPYGGGKTSRQSSQAGVRQVSKAKDVWRLTVFFKKTHVELGLEVVSKERERERVLKWVQSFRSTVFYKPPSFSQDTLSSNYPCIRKCFVSCGTHVQQRENVS